MSGLTTIRACYADPLLYRHFHHTLDSDTAATRSAKENEQWLFLWAECVAGIFLSSIAFAVAGLRASDGVQARDASFVLLNGCFGSVIIFIIITRQIELSNLAAHRRRVVAAIPPSMDAGNIESAPVVATRVPKRQGGCTINLEDVSLTYATGLPPVIVGMHLSIPAGQRVGMVGRTGSGKSTLIRALSGLLTPAHGTIVLDGRSLGSIPKQELRETVCVIPQVPHLFADTIRFNLDPVQKHSDAELWAALQEANADKLISRDAKGLDARISSAGADLSSGERQLLCLARALLHRARLILLDEATAALDDTLMASTEAALAACAQTATIIQIAHQTMAVADCDRVIVLHAGVVVEDGAPAELMKKKDGGFATMVRHDSRRLRSTATL
jgi:ABC-type multidrug transport system fused ATPase/permease subunit